MSDLPEFLLARVAEDEDAALAATPGPWTAAHGDVWTEPEFDLHRFDNMGECVASTKLSDADAAHIARHDPARVLAECEAKRRLIALGEKDSYWEDVLRLLALPYADYEDYREEWRP